MQVTIEPVALADKAALWVELQDYIKGFLAYDDLEDVDGVYPYGYFDAYWQESTRWPFWAVADGERAGFALLRREDDGAMDMAEFYIQPRFRRSGIGLEFARELLRRFPGRWLISEYRANKGAVAFWRKVIEGYEYAEEAYIGEDSGKPRLLQRVTVA